MADNNGNKRDWSQIEAGAFWKREGKNQKYLSGKASKKRLLELLENISDDNVPLIVFAAKKTDKNGNPLGEHTPDYRFYVNVDLASGAAPVQKTQKQVRKPAPVAAQTQDSDDVL